MITVLKSAFGDNASPVWAPWFVLGAVVLYFVGYVDSAVHGAAIGSPAILGAVLLWTAPRPIEAYETEARPGQAKKPRRWKFKRSILAHLVAGAVRWRRTLIQLNEQDKSAQDENCPAGATRLELKVRGGFRKRVWWRYLVGLAVFTGSAYAAATVGAAGHPFQLERILSSLAAYFEMIRAGGTALLQRLPAMGLILSFCYLATMLYTLLQYFKAKKKGAGGK